VPNYVEAHARFERACNAGESLGCVGLGGLYLYAEGVAKDAKRALELFDKSCDAGEPLACAYLGEMYKDGNGVGGHLPKALEYGRRACEAGEPYGCNVVASTYRDPAIKDMEKSVQYMRKACMSDDPTSCVQLGNWNKWGDPMPKNFPEAKVLYERACESRFVPGYEEDDVVAMGCYEAASLYHYGQGIPQDGPRATRLYKRACDRKYELACSSLKKITTEPLPKPGELRYVPVDELEDP
jgi:TPR repeat protein